METKTYNNTSLLNQTIASVMFLSAMGCSGLHKGNFMDIILKDYPESDICNIKHILYECGLGNPAMLQMCLYALLLVHRELLGDDYCMKETNEFVSNNIIQVSSSYPDDQNDEVNYYRHIRNPIAHSKADSRR